MGKQQYVPFDVVVELNCNGFGRRSPVVVVVGVGVGGDVDDVVVVVVGADDPWAGARGAKQEVVGEGGAVGGGKEEVRGIPATEGRAWGKHRAGHPLFLSLQFLSACTTKSGLYHPVHDLGVHAKGIERVATCLHLLRPTCADFIHLLIFN